MPRSLLITAVVAACIILAISPAAAFGFTDNSSTNLKQNNLEVLTQRRQFISTAITIASWTGATPFISPVNAIDVESLPTEASTIVEEVTMKTFVDSATPSLFAINVPQRFFSIRRTSKGDLPDAKTGKGRRGGTIFSAGDMAKAEVIAVERFPVRNLLEEEGYEATGDLTNFKSIGEPVAIATLLIRRREKDKPGDQNTAVLNKDSVSLSPDGQTLIFTMRQEINVQKPELLMEEIGVSELFRNTVAKATLTSNDGQMMAVFASALDQDFNGPDGVALQKAVDSFIATDQSAK